MKWLWKDHGKVAIKAGKGSPQMQAVLLPAEGWRLVADNFKFTEGPIADAKGEVFFTDVPNGKTFQVRMDPKLSDPVAMVNGDNGKASGFAFGPDGAMYGVGGGLGVLVKYGADGKRTVIADGIKGNDLVALHNGDFYVTAPGNPDQIIHVRDGKKTVVDTGIQFSNGITVSPDQTLLYVAESRTHWVWSYQIQPDGTLKHKQKFFHLHAPDTADNAWPDGLKCDTDGRLYVATNYGVQFCDQAGRVNGILPTPNGKAANLCFGGPKFDTLYVTAGDKVYSRKLKVTGVNTFAKPIKPAPPRL
jgi:sugar lactone lactonase YvrE